MALAAVALAALALSLVLALVSTLPRPHAARTAAVQTAPPARFGAPPTGVPRPAAAPAASAAAKPRQPATLWTLLAPPALVVDALAVLALALVFALRHALPGPRGARR